MKENYCDLLNALACGYKDNRYTQKIIVTKEDRYT